MPGPSSLKGITCTWNQVVRGGCVHCSSGHGRGIAHRRLRQNRARVGDGHQDEGGEAVGGHHQLPCITCVGSTTMPWSHHTHGEVVQVTACGLQLLRRGVDFDGQGLAQMSGVSGVMSMVSGSRVVPLGAVTSSGAALLTDTLTLTGKATAVGGKFT